MRKKELASLLSKTQSYGNVSWIILVAGPSVPVVRLNVRIERCQVSEYLQIFCF